MKQGVKDFLQDERNWPYKIGLQALGILALGSIVAMSLGCLSNVTNNVCYYYCWFHNDIVHYLYSLTGSARYYGVMTLVSVQFVLIIGSVYLLESTIRSIESYAKFKRKGQK